MRAVTLCVRIDISSAGFDPKGCMVAAFDPARFLILEWKAPDGARLVSWAFVLESAGSGATRLVVRARGGRGYRFRGLPWWLTKRIIPIVHFVMIDKTTRDHSGSFDFIAAITT